MKQTALEKEHARLTRAIERIDDATTAKKEALEDEAEAKKEPLRLSLAAIETAMKTIELGTQP